MKATYFLLSLLVTSLTLTTGLSQQPDFILQSGHNRPIKWMQYTPDGQYLLTADGKTIRTWEAATYKLLNVKNLVQSQSLNLLYNPRLVSGNYGIIPPYALTRDSRYRDYDRFKNIAFSADSELFLYSTSYAIYRYPLGQYAKESQLHYHKKGMGYLAVSAKGKVYAFPKKKHIIIRDLQLNKRIKKIKHRFGTIQAMAISPDEKYLLAINKKGKGTAWIIPSGKKVSSPIFNLENIQHIQFIKEGHALVFTGDQWHCHTFPEGKRLYSLAGDGKAIAVAPQSGLIYASMGEKLAAYREQNGTEVLPAQRFSSPVQSIALHPNGKEMAIGLGDNSMVVYKLPDFERKHLEQNRKNSTEFLAFSLDEKYMASSHSDSTIKIWDFVQGKLAHTLSLPDGITQSMAFNTDGKLLFCGSSKGNIHVWNVVSGQLDTTIAAHRDSIIQMKLDTTGTRLLSLGHKALKVWNLENKFHLERTIEATTEFRFFAIRDHQNTLLLLDAIQQERYNQKMIYTEWGIGDGNKVDEGSLSFMSLEKASISPDGRYLVMASAAVSLKRRRVVVFDLLEKKPIITLFNLDAIEFLMFSPDGKKLFVAGDDHTFTVFDWETIKQLDYDDRSNSIEELGELSGHYESINAATFSPSGKYFVSAANDLQLIIWNLEKKQPALVLTTFNDKDAWIVKDATGRFDGSEQSFEYLHYAVDHEVVRFNQLKERYYRPKLLSTALDQEDELVNIPYLKNVPLYPKMEATIKGDSLLVKLQSRDGGIGRTALFIGNKEIIADINPERKSNFGIDLADYRKYFGPAGNYSVGLQNWNQEGWLSSSIKRFNYSFQPSIVLEALHPKVYIVSIGVSDYKGDEIDLRYAEKDAQFVAKVLTNAAEALLGKDQARTYLFTSAEQQDSLAEHTYASKKNIKARFDQLSTSVQPQDVLIVYLSGHGTTYETDGKDQFYYLSPEMGSFDIRDPYIRESQAISTEELSLWLNDIASQKTVLILDACAAGTFNQGLDEDLLVSRGSTPSQIRAIERLKDRTGLFVLSGSTADKSSFEASRFGQGLLTYSLLLGIKGGEGLRNNEFIDVLNWFNYAKEKVPVLASQIGGIQDPMIFMPYQSETYDIGQASEQVRQGITIANPKPFFTRARLSQQGTAFDELGLEAAVNKQLEAYSEMGVEAPLIFIDESHSIAAFQIGGIYELEGEQITASCQLRYDRKSWKEAFIVIGSTDNPEKLAKKIVQEAYKYIK